MSNTRRPRRHDDGRPYDFDLGAVKAGAELRPFVVRDADGTRWTFAHMDSLNIWPLLAAAEQGDNMAMRAVFREALGQQWEEFQKRPMPGYRMLSLFKAYQKHCGAAEGESLASTDS
ncbi:hypothetical protein ACIRRH_15470 [Kitasatospora sp. NPDC101235]|uniref:hypothetical protein n=1 Tax=Kitasatospora sp. NPDC101235 TaxID=3364101 RepID=UPI00382D09D9